MKAIDRICPFSNAGVIEECHSFGGERIPSCSEIGTRTGNAHEGSLESFRGGICQDGDGREIAERVLLGVDGIREDIRKIGRVGNNYETPWGPQMRTIPTSKPIIHIRRNLIVAAISETANIEAPGTQTNGRRRKCIAPNYTSNLANLPPQSWKRKHVQDLFSKESKRRGCEEAYMECRRMEDEVIWVTNDEVGLARCAQCE